MESTSIYLHVPFCSGQCSYCPFTHVEFDEKLLGPYQHAALAEVDRWADSVGRARIESIYVGGGSPSLALDAVEAVLERIRERFDVAGDVCMELNPADTDEESIARVKRLGVKQVSLGVLSFDQEHLKDLERCYTPEQAERALTLLSGAGFESVNVDLMFALPRQTPDQLKNALVHASTLGATQITSYPMYAFPFAPAATGPLTASPDSVTRKQHYRIVAHWCEEHGFERSSIWSYRRPHSPHCDALPRHGYLGIGPGAGSVLPDGFTLNTFDFMCWLDALETGVSPIALRMPFEQQTAGWWWLYWRLYDTRVPLADLEQHFGDETERALRWLGALERFGLARRDNEHLELTERGAVWLHLVQNHVSLQYISTVWTAARKNPWPLQVSF